MLLSCYIMFTSRRVTKQLIVCRSRFLVGGSVFSSLVLRPPRVRIRCAFADSLGKTVAAADDGSDVRFGGRNMEAPPRRSLFPSDNARAMRSTTACGRGHRIAHRKWKETKLHIGTAGPGNRLGFCLVSSIPVGHPTGCPEVSVSTLIAHISVQSCSIRKSF